MEDNQPIIDVEKEIEFISKYAKVKKEIVNEILHSQDRFFLTIGAMSLEDYAVSISTTTDKLDKKIIALYQKGLMLSEDKKCNVTQEERLKFVSEDTGFIPDTVQEVFHYEDMYLIEIGVIDEDEYYQTMQKTADELSETDK